MSSPRKPTLYSQITGFFGKSSSPEPEPISIELINQNFNVCLDALCSVPEFKDATVPSSFLYRLAQFGVEMLQDRSMPDSRRTRAAIIEVFEAALFINPRLPSADYEQFLKECMNGKKENIFLMEEGRKEKFATFLQELTQQDMEKYLKSIVERFLIQFNLNSKSKDNTSTIPELLFRLGAAFNVGDVCSQLSSETNHNLAAIFGQTALELGNKNAEVLLRTLKDDDSSIEFKRT